MVLLGNKTIRVLNCNDLEETNKIELGCAATHFYYSTQNKLLFIHDANDYYNQKFCVYEIDNDNKFGNKETLL